MIGEVKYITLDEMVLRWHEERAFSIGRRVLDIRL